MPGSNVGPEGGVEAVKIVSFVSKNALPAVDDSQFDCEVKL